MTTATASSSLSKAHRDAVRNCLQFGLSAGYILRQVEKKFDGTYTGALKDADPAAVKAYLANRRPNRDPRKEAARKAKYGPKADTQERFEKVVKGLTLGKIKAWLKTKPTHILCPSEKARAGSCLVADYLRHQGFPNAEVISDGCWRGDGEEFPIVYNPTPIADLVRRFDRLFPERNIRGDRVLATCFN